MAKIIKFPQSKIRLTWPKVVVNFADYSPADNCCNDDSYGYVCVKCEKCGRRFVDGLLQKDGAE